MFLPLTGVKDVGVTAAPDEALGEIPAVFIVPSADGFDTDELLAACRAHLRVPVKIFETESIPRTSSGKVVRRALLDRPATLRASTDIAEHIDEVTEPESSPSGSGRLRSADDIADVVHALLSDIVGDHPRGGGNRATFKELGLTSLTAVQFCRRLSRVLGRELSTTLAFDHPTPTALVRHLHAELNGIEDVAPETSTRAIEPGEPLAIVSMACRYPGGVSSPDDLWRLVRDEIDVITEQPSDRGWDVDGLRGGFLDDVAGFDAGLFGISPREALVMDPQQRLLLESTWELLERAGMRPDSLMGSNTGVFVGAMHQGYARDPGPAGAGAEGYLVTGTAGSVISGRISYVFGFEGPAVTVDTACSSSLVALHMAVQALRSGECDLAVAGGVTVMASPEVFTNFGRQGALSADGRCKAFAEGADGTGWS
ncbi:acyl carrier protein, partial [Rhodococcus ruber]|uniref:acyl carrier protein n=1 Tax=Rhodococcus ruber TaxID=1830 RepID=UPI0023B87B91